MEELVEGASLLDDAVQGLFSAQAAQPQRADAEALAFEAAMAVVGGRFRLARQACQDADFVGADPKSTQQCINALQVDPASVLLARDKEQMRIEKMMALILNVPETEKHCREDPVWQFTKFSELMKSGCDLLAMSEFEIMQWSYTFELTEVDDRRFFAYKIMYKRYSLLPKSTGGYVKGGQRLRDLTAAILGKDVVYSIHHIKEMVAKGIEEPSPIGRPTALKPETTTILFKFIAHLRRLRYPVYRSVIINYLQRLLEGTEESLMFAQISNGEFVRDEVNGGVKWDYAKLFNYFYRALPSPPFAPPRPPMSPAPPQLPPSASSPPSLPAPPNPPSTPPHRCPRPSLPPRRRCPRRRLATLAAITITVATVTTAAIAAVATTASATTLLFTRRPLPCASPAALILSTDP